MLFDAEELELDDAIEDETIEEREEETTDDIDEVIEEREEKIDEREEDIRELDDEGFDELLETILDDSDEVAPLHKPPAITGISAAPFFST